ncbi:hypothetical protein [Salipiger sp.]|uniref:hypothetical protein n=1 Tax=Salipiger sp. TaxID=2078585 RepID=UPI003A969205
MKTLVLGAALALVLTAATLPAGARAQDHVPTVIAPQVETPTRVLLVGNSYLYYGDSLHNHLSRMVEADNPGIDLEWKSATIGGARLADHDIDRLTTPGAIGVDEPFQLVLLQGHSAAALSEANQERFRSAATAAAEVIAARGGKVALYMPQAYVAPHKRADPENIRRNEAFYTDVGNELGALVVPVALAFEEAYKRRPEIRLHKDFDGSHPSILGTYLAAATAYATLYGTSPVGNAYDYFGTIAPEDAAFLQQVAQDVVTAYHGG